MSNPQAIESLVRDLHELANEADGKKDVSGVDVFERQMFGSMHRN